MNTSWTLLTSHGQVLFYVAAHPDATIPRISDALGLSERRVGIILQELRNDNMIEATRVGRRNRYTVNLEATFRHPAMAYVRLGEVIDAFTGREPPPAESPQKDAELLIP
jgi:predicted transcriptional regulator